MKDHLTDIITHTHSLGFIDLVKVISTDDTTKIEAAAQDKSVVIQGEFKNKVTEFNGIFGMPNLGKLDTLLTLPEYDKNATIEVIDQNGQLAGLHFDNEAGDFQNDYRFMSTKQIEEIVKGMTFKGASWSVEITPNLTAIERFKHMWQANDEEIVFDAKTDGTDLKFSFGDHSSHAGEFTFANNVSGSIGKIWAYPIGPVLRILGLVGDTVMSFSDAGALQITVDNGVSVYKYILPAQMK